VPQLRQLRPYSFRAVPPDAGRQNRPGVARGFFLGKGAAEYGMKPRCSCHRHIRGGVEALIFLPKHLRRGFPASVLVSIQQPSPARSALGERLGLGALTGGISPMTARCSRRAACMLLRPIGICSSKAIKYCRRSHTREQCSDNYRSDVPLGAVCCGFPLSGPF
jgi:hypothetical protein